MPNVREIRRSLGVPDLVTLSPGGEATAEPMSDLDRALEYRDRTFGQRVMRTTERQAEAVAKAEAATAELEEAEAHLKTKETHLRIREIEEHLKSSGGDGLGGGMGQIIQLLHEDRQQSQAQQAEAQGELMRLLQDQVKDLREQSLARLTEPTNGHGPSTLTEQVQQARDLLEIIRSLSPTPATESLNGMGQSVEEVIKLYELKEGHEDRMADRKEAHEERMARLHLERERFDDERDERRERSVEDKRRGESLTNTLERALPYAQELVQNVGQRVLGGTGGAAPRQESPAPSFGPGTRIAPCPQCKVLIPFPLGQDIGTCPGCGMVCTIQLDETETPATPEARVPTSEPPAPAPAPEAAPARQPEEMEAEVAAHAV